MLRGRDPDDSDVENDNIDFNYSIGDELPFPTGDQPSDDESENAWNAIREDDVTAGLSAALDPSLLDGINMTKLKKLLRCVY